MNALRGLLFEYGAIFRVGLTQTKRIEAYIRSSDAELPALVVAECKDLLQISEQTAWIEITTTLLARAAASSETAHRYRGRLLHRRSHTSAPTECSLKGGQPGVGQLLSVGQIAQ